MREKSRSEATLLRQAGGSDKLAGEPSSILFVTVGESEADSTLGCWVPGGFVAGELWLRRIRPVATRVRRPELFVVSVLLTSIFPLASGVDGSSTIIAFDDSEVGVSTESILAKLADSLPLDACRINGRSKLRALRFGAKAGLVDSGAAVALEMDTSVLRPSLGLTDVVVRAMGADCTSEELDLRFHW